MKSFDKTEEKFNSHNTKVTLGTYLYNGKVITASSKKQVIRIIASNEKVVARDRNHLEVLIKEAIKKYGSNCDLNFIDTSRVTDMSYVFFNSKFNGDISNWNVSKVEEMTCMFRDSKFNGDVSKWLPMMKKNGIKFDDLCYPVDENMFNDIEV